MGWEGSPISPWGDTGLTLSQNQAPVTRELGAQRTPRDRRTKDQGYFTHKCPLPQIYPETRNLENQTQKFSKEKDLKKKKPVTTVDGASSIQNTHLSLSHISWTHASMYTSKPAADVTTSWKPS